MSCFLKSLFMVYCHIWQQPQVGTDVAMFFSFPLNFEDCSVFLPISNIPILLLLPLSKQRHMSFSTLKELTFFPVFLLKLFLSFSFEIVIWLHHSYDPFPPPMPSQAPLPALFLIHTSSLLCNRGLVLSSVWT